MKIGRHRIDVSNRDKVFFPDTNLTKGDLIDYYHQVADTMIPHMKNYGVSMHRFPDGIEGESFFNKTALDYFPAWIRKVECPKREGGSFDAPIVDGTAALVYLADQAMVTPHLYLSRIDDLEHPDRMIYDLDPPEGQESGRALREAALDVRDVLNELDLTAWVQTTGSKGFHIVVPVDRESSFEAVREFATRIARLLIRRSPQRYTLQQRKSKRKGRIFLDTLRNAYGATAVAPYAVRARPRAPVATPLTWQEVEKGASPAGWTIRSIPQRLKQKQDPWAHMMRHAQSIAARRGVLDRYLDRETAVDEVED